MTPKPIRNDESLDEPLEVKVREFANRMALSGARNLYLLLIRAVEKPLITQVLTEAKWNQLQAAQILGLNRNTLRKKIRDLSIRRPGIADKEPRRKRL